jgi:signal peptidase II
MSAPAGRVSAGRAWAWVGATAAAVVGVDQVAKQVAVAALEPGQSESVFIGLELTHVRNTGIAFGALSGGGALVLALIAGALILLLVYFARHASTPGLWLPVGVVLGGALGNLADRAREGTVIDFIDPIVWPAFNLADMAIVGGVLGLLYVAGSPRRSEPGRSP